MALVLRSAIADYINVGTKYNQIWSLCGVGFNNIDESPNAQVESKIYVHQNDTYASITRYESSFSFDTDMWNEQDAVMMLYNIARNRMIGENAVVQFLRTDFLIDKEGNTISDLVGCRLFNCVAEVTDISGSGGEILSVKGTMHTVGKFETGYFDLKTRTFVEEISQYLITDPADGNLYYSSGFSKFTLELNTDGDLYLVTGI